MMGSGFGHFDGSHTENFCAGALLLLMDLDVRVKDIVTTMVCEKLGKQSKLLDFGRKALGETDDGEHLRVDLWLHLAAPVGGVAYVEVKIVPKSEERFREHCWLEAYCDATEKCVAVPGPERLDRSHLDEVRKALVTKWNEEMPRTRHRARG